MAETAESTNSSTPVRAGTLTHIVSIATGYYHSCALSSSGAVSCWGYNSLGQLGDGTFVNESSPVRVVGLGKALAISVGAYHSCASVVGSSDQPKSKVEIPRPRLRVGP